MIPPLLMALLSPAHADRPVLTLANDRVHDGVHGLELVLDAPEARVLRHRDVRLDPASQRVYPVLRDLHGRVVYDGRAHAGVAPDQVRATTTPALPADDGVHTFFVPYHRLDLAGGRHELQVELTLDADLAEGPVRVLDGTAAVDMPALDWSFIALDQPAGVADPVRWRVRLGKDVMVTRSTLPALVVATPRDALVLEVLDGERWVQADPATVDRVARAHGLTGLDLRQTRQAPPGITDAHARVTVFEGATPGVRLGMQWRLTGPTADVLIPIEARPYVVDADGVQWPLPSRALTAQAGRASHLVPSWGLPESVSAGGSWTVGWSVRGRAGAGSPLSRDVELGRAELQVPGPSTLPEQELDAAVVGARLVDQDGLVLDAKVSWRVPVRLSQRGRSRVQARWHGVSEEASPWSQGPWTSCGALQDHVARCGGPRRVGVVRVPGGISELRLPLAPIAAQLKAGEQPTLLVQVSEPGQRALQTRLTPAVPELQVLSVQVRPSRAELVCAAGEQAYIVVTAQGDELARTPGVPCADGARWDKTHRITLPALAGDVLQIGVQVGERVLRRRPLRVVPGTHKPDLTEPTAGVDQARLKVRIR